MSSELTTALRAASDRNTALLTTLSQTAYAPPSLKQNLAYLDDLSRQIAHLDRELKKFHEITEDERKDHVKYRDSTVKRFMHRLGGSRGVEKFETKREKEEREFLDAWQREREAREARAELVEAVKKAKEDKGKLEKEKDRYETAQRELDQLYAEIFEGVTPGLPGEDEREEQVKQARGGFEEAQTGRGREEHALEAVETALGMLRQARADMGDAHDMSRWDMWGGGTFVDLMERDALSKAQNQVTQALRHMDDARKVQPLIRPLDAIDIDQGHFISDVMFDSIFTDMAQNDRIKASEAQVERAVAQLEKTQVPEQQDRVRRAKTEVLLAGQRLESARMELQRIRAEAFEKLAGDDQPPEYSG